MSDFGCHFGAPKSSKLELKFDQKSSTDLEHLGASRGRFRFDFGPIWGSSLGARARDAKLAANSNAPRREHYFRGPRRPRKSTKLLWKPASSGNLTPRASWGLWSSMLEHFRTHFEHQNRSSNGTNNKLHFKRFWDAPGNYSPENCMVA